MMSWCIDSEVNTLAHQHLDMPILRKGCMKFGDIWKNGIKLSRGREADYIQRMASHLLQSRRRLGASGATQR